MKLPEFKDLLTSYVDGQYPVSHYFFIKENYPYLRWQEIQQEGKMHANNRPSFLPWTVVLDYFTRTEFDPAVDDLIDFLCKDDDIAFKSRSVASTTDTGLILHEITLEVV